MKNRKISHYRCIAKIGSGGFSEVWRATDGHDATGKIAIKLMKKDAASDRKTRGMFEREWKVVRSFNHPGTLKYYSYGIFQDLPYLVMDFFPGSTLRQLITDRPEWVKAKAAELFTATCRALTYLHQQGVVHRDLKPENIMVNEEGEVRLIDFSNAQGRWQRMLGMDRKMEGTPTYMAPEQLTGQKTTPQTDLYSLGATFFEVLTGRPPFTGCDANEIMTKNLRTQPPKTSSFNREVTSELDKFIQTLLAKTPAERPFSAEVALRRFEGVTMYLSN